MRYRKIISKSSVGRKCEASSNEARFIFNVGEEDGDDTDDNTDDKDDDDNHCNDNLNVNARSSMMNRVVYEKPTSGPINGNEFYIKSTNDIDAIEFHCNGVNNAINVNTTNCSSSPTSSQPPSTSSRSNCISNNRRISSRSNVHS